MKEKILVNKVRAGFIARGSSLHRYCLDQGLDSSNTTKTLLGKWNSPRAIILRQQIIDAAGLSNESARLTQED